MSYNSLIGLFLPDFLLLNMKLKLFCFNALLVRKTKSDMHLSDLNLFNIKVIIGKL